MHTWGARDLESHQRHEGDRAHLPTKKLDLVIHALLAPHALHALHANFNT